MHRIEGKEVDKSTGKNLFNDAPPFTVMTPAWANSVQEELMNVILTSGLTALTEEEDTRSQLLQAINILIQGRQWATATYYSVGTEVYRYNTKYFCATAHTSATFYSDWLTSGYWIPLNDHPGKIIIHPKTSAIAGYLLLDNKTVGDASSGADYAGDRYRELYEFLNNSFGGTYNWAAHSKINLPEIAEVALVGIGTRSSGVTAHDVFTIGQMKDDAKQGSAHVQGLSAVAASAPGRYGRKDTGISGGATDYYTASTATEGYLTSGDVDDGSHGTPRLDSVTRGKRLGMNFVIKY